ncbi:MAG: ATP-binding protein [Leptospiraceae bacterium]|nr:ATP-binding protein [Leptospiraceae bacterium]
MNIEIRRRKTLNFILIHNILFIGFEFGLSFFFFDYSMNLIYFFCVLFFFQCALSAFAVVYILPRLLEAKAGEIQSALAESEQLNLDLSSRFDELIRRHVIVSNSEKKYKQLLENSTDIYFSLDEDMNILMVNKKIKDHLGIKPQDVIGKPFFDLVYVAPMQRGSLDKLMVLEKFEEMKNQKSGLTFKVNFYTSHKEPKELDVHLEYIQTETDFAIFGKASQMVEDSILLYCQSERKKYIIGNYINLAEQVSHRVTMNIHKYLDPETVLSIKICLREIIINAIEHGNLGITYDEKTKMKESGNYFKFISERQNDPACKLKKVTIDYSLRPDKVTYLIADEGKGFDYKKILKKAEDANMNNLSHGRGIIMTLGTFDTVKYNEIGNEVFLSKNLSGPIH